jgi:hypothetical protein
VPEDYVCPVCNSSRASFEANTKVVAGFAENQKYGLGFNTFTGSQKLLVIYGILAVLFLILVGGYALE